MLAFDYLRTVKGPKVIAYYLLYKWYGRTFRLKDDKTSFSFASSTSADLRHHHIGMLISTEIRIVEHCVSIEDAHYRHLVKVESLGYHLCTYQDIRAPC